MAAPLSAYDVMDELRDDYPSIAPPTVYRALASLTERGSVRRLDSLRAFVASQSEHQHALIMSICDDCGSVEESAAPGLREELARIAGKFRMTSTRHVIEVHGTCSACDAEKVHA